MATLSEFLNSKLVANIAAEKVIEEIKEKQIDFENKIESEIADLQEQNEEISDTVDTVMIEVIPSLQEVE